MPSLTTRLEGEANTGLEAVQQIGFGLEQGSAANRAAGPFINDRLRRRGGGVNANEATRIGKQVDKTVRKDPECALDHDEVKRPEGGGPVIEHPNNHCNVRAAVKFGLGRFRCACVGFQKNNLRAHCSENRRAIARSARDIERTVAGDDRRRLEQPREAHRREQAAELRPSCRQLAIQIRQRLVLRPDEALTRHVEERGQYGLIDNSVSAQLAVDHVHAPVEHRFKGNVRPLGSDPRYGTDRPPRTKIVWRPRVAAICSPSLMALKISESWLKKQAAPAFGATTFWDSDISGFGLRFFAPTRRHAPGARSFSVNYRVRRRESGSRSLLSVKDGLATDMVERETPGL